MGIRIQPREIEVPEDDPFQNDLLTRKESAEVLTHLVGKIEGPCVLAVDAAWGTGKTTFLKIWAQHLRNQKFPVVEFNAWETDFSGDPFVALTTELTEGLRQYGKLAAKIEATKKVAEEFVLRASLGAIRVASAGVVDLAPLMKEKDDRLTAHKNAQELVGKFRTTLQDMAKELSSPAGHHLVVVIDELDRCRPSYAVELLEVAKHLFSVDRIVFVLAVNRSELAHSIRALYGNNFGAEGYLRRFFDVDFRLPEPDRKSFIDAMMDAQQIEKHFGEALKPNTVSMFQNRTADEVASARELLQAFLSVPSFSLHQIVQTVHRLGLVFASLQGNQRSLPIPAVLALVLRALDANLYHQFCSGEVSDRDLIEAVFKRPEIQALREKPSGHLFEAAIIAAKYELSLGYSVDWEQSASPLLSDYITLVSDETPEADSSDPRLRRGHEVIRLVELFQRKTLTEGTMGFKHSVQRIELLSPSLIGEQ